MSEILFVIAVILAILGVVQIVKGEPVLGLVLLVLACAVGPGGWYVGSAF